MGYPVQIALRYLGSKKRAFVSVGTAFAMLGVALGVAALSTGMSISGGLQEQFRDKVLGVNAHVIVLKYAVHFRDYRDVMAKVEATPGVVAAAPFIINPMMVTHGERTATGVLLKGVDPERMARVLDLPRYVTSGSLEGLRRPGAMPQAAPPSNPFSTLSHPNPLEDALRDDDAPLSESKTPTTPTPSSRSNDRDDSSTAIGDAVPMPAGQVTPEGGYASSLPDVDVLPESVDPDPCRSPAASQQLPGIAIGVALAKRLDAHLGDCVQVTSPQIGALFSSSGGRGPIAKQFRLIAIFEAGFDQYDAKLVYTDVYEAQAFYDQGDSVTGIEAKVNDIGKAAAIAKSVQQTLANGIYHTMDWRELNHSLFTALLIQQIAMSVVLTLIIVVAAFTVIATLIMVVLDKRKEIALLKALGAHNSAILRIFLYQGAFIGVGGTALGLLLASIGCNVLNAHAIPLDSKVYFISKLPATVRPAEFAITGVLALVICLVATIFPSLYAARMRPTEGLRAE